MLSLCCFVVLLCCCVVDLFLFYVLFCRCGVLLLVGVLCVLFGLLCWFNVMVCCRFAVRLFVRCAVV